MARQTQSSSPTRIPSPYPQSLSPVLIPSPYPQCLRHVEERSSEFRRVAPVLRRSHRRASTHDSWALHASPVLRLDVIHADRDFDDP
jgi:hypothetical protein